MTEETKAEEEEEEEESAPGSTLFIKNLNFSTLEEKLEEVGQFMNTTLVHIIFFLSYITFCLMLFFCFLCRHSPNVARLNLAQSLRRKIKQVLKF